MKFPREKEAMLIYEDTFPLVASVNTIAFYLEALKNLKNVGRILLGPKTRNIWIPKKYLTYKNDLIAGVSVVKEKKNNGGNPNHSFGKNSIGLEQEVENKKFSKENNVSQKERHASLRKKGMNDH